SETFYAFTQETEDPTCAVRARHVWFGRVTPGEDPVTGSAAGCLGAYLVHENVLLAAPTAEVRIEQGVEIGRPGVVDAFVDVEGKRIQRVRVGGRAVHVGDVELGCCPAWSRRFGVQLGDLLACRLQVLGRLHRQETVVQPGALDLDELRVEVAGQLADQAFDLHDARVADLLLDVVPAQVEVAVER